MPSNHPSPGRHPTHRAQRVGVVGLMIGLSGCGAQTAFRSATDNAIVAPTPQMVLAAAYDLEGGDREVIFLSTENLSVDEAELLMASLEDELGIDVLPADLAFRGDPDLPALTPIDPETGSIGVSLTLRRLVEVDANEYEATVSYARSGLDGGDLVLQLVRVQNNWQVIGVIHNAPS